jgi:hypothetical protein
MSQITEHFHMEEFMPPCEHPDPPDSVMVCLKRLCEDLLEPLRVQFDRPISITSGWRPAAYNAQIGGAVNSDHITGRAADIQVGADDGESWELNTIKAYNWLRTEKAGSFGQIILEDHRIHRKQTHKLWIHVAIPSARHPGTESDKSRVLVSFEPGKYQTQDSIA